ncbi:MAG: hypothetical protein KDB14_20840 [Planctomycetales bacterium]|nr:hypothetical protein [Planctomycetales bacterium]
MPVSPDHPPPLASRGRQRSRRGISHAELLLALSLLALATTLIIQGATQAQRVLRETRRADQALELAEEALERASALPWLPSPDTEALNAIAAMLEDEPRPERTPHGPQRPVGESERPNTFDVALEWLAESDIATDHAADSGVAQVGKLQATVSWKNHTGDRRQVKLELPRSATPAMTTAEHGNSTEAPE